MRLRVLPLARRHKERRPSKVQGCERRRKRYRHWHAMLPAKMVNAIINESDITIVINVAYNAYKKW